MLDSCWVILHFTFFSKLLSLLLYNRRILTKKNSKDEDGRNTWAFLRNLGDKRPWHVINRFGYDEVGIFNIYLICYALQSFFNCSNLKQILAMILELGWGRLCPLHFCFPTCRFSDLAAPPNLSKVFVLTRNLFRSVEKKK